MVSFGVALLLIACSFFGLVLGYAVFVPLINPKQKRLLLCIYAVVTAADILIMTLALHFQGLTAAFAYLRYGIILYALGMTLVNILVIRGKTREHLFVFGVVLTCNYLLMSVPNYAVSFLRLPDVNTNLYVILALYIGVLLLSIWPLYILLYNTVTQFLEMDLSKYWNTAWSIPIAFFGTKFVNLGGAHDSGGITQLASSALYIFVIVLLCLSIAASQRRIRDHHVMQQQLDAQKIHYTELKVRVEDARKAHHDLKHQIAAVRHYIETDDKEGLRQFCDAFLQSHTVEQKIPYTGNTAADGVLYHYMKRAAKDGIRFHYTGTIHSPGIADVDLCVLLGNALDNAFAGCMTLERNRSVSLISQSESTMLSVVVQNTFDGQIKQENEEILSRKQENRRGVGLKSMRSICRRYGGTMDIQWDDNTFTAIFILPLKNE